MLDRSTKTFEKIISDSKQKIGLLIINSKEKVKTGTRIAHECEDVLNEIVSSVASVSKMITEISAASLEQAQGVHEITKAITQLDQVTHQNASNASQSANAAGTLSMQAEELNSLIQSLSKTINGGRNEMTSQNLSVVLNSADEAEFSFDNAIQAHAMWKQKLANYIKKADKSLSHNEICLDNKCPLGKWIYGEGTKYSHIAEYKKLKPAHAKFHKEAANIINKVNSGAKMDSEIALNASSAFANSSKEVAQLILSLKNKITNEIPIKTVPIEKPSLPKINSEKVMASSLPSSEDSRFTDV
jgi:methyl-accepting chemotaxis protein